MNDKHDSDKNDQYKDYHYKDSYKVDNQNNKEEKNIFFREGLKKTANFPLFVDKRLTPLDTG